MDLKVEGTALQALIEKATIDALGTAGQEALVKEVVRHLTTSPSNSYGQAQPSPLMTALHNASSAAALRYFQSKLESDPAFTDALEGLYRDAVKTFLGAE